LESSKRTLTLTAAILTGADIAVAGLIGFVGLLVPHAVRLVSELRKNRAIHTDDRLQNQS